MYRIQRTQVARHISRAVALGAALFVTPLASSAQQSRPTPYDLGVASGARLRAHADSVSGNAQKTFFVKRDLVSSGVAFAASVGMSAFDLRIAHWARSPGVQGDSSRHDLVEQLTRANETPMMLAALATYGVGRVAGRQVAEQGGVAERGAGDERRCAAGRPIHPVTSGGSSSPLLDGN